MIKELTKTENARRLTAWKHINRHIRTYSKHVSLDRPEFQHAWNDDTRQYITTPIYVIETLTPIDGIPRLEDTMHILPPRFRISAQRMIAEPQHNTRHLNLPLYEITDTDLEHIERAYKEKRNMIRINGVVFTPCYIRDVIRMIAPNIKKYPVYMYAETPTSNAFLRSDIGSAVLAPINTKDGEYDAYIKEHNFID